MSPMSQFVAPQVLDPLSGHTSTLLGIVLGDLMRGS